MNYSYMLQVAEKLLVAEEKNLRELEAEINSEKGIDAAEDALKVLFQPWSDVENIYIEVY